MRASVVVRGRVLFALVLCAALAGCADENDPAYLASLLDDPVETENALEKLRKLLDERLQIQDPKEQAASVGDFGARATDGLVGAFTKAEGNPLVQTRIISVLTRTIAYTKSMGQRKKILNDVFFPVLDRFKERGEDPAQASLVVDTIASMMKPPIDDKPLLDPSEIEAAVAKFRDVTQSVRASWGCKERYVRMQGRESPVADQEQLLLSCISGTAQLLGHEASKGAQGAGVAVLLDALRESFFFQDFYLNRAAADAIDDVAPFLGPDFVRQVAPALVEGLFLQGDFFLYPYTRRALVHLAALSPENRDIVVDELLRALNVDMDPEVAKALPELEGLGKNERLDLLRLPCGTTLSVSCAEKEGTLREYRDQGWPPGKAACNRGADPDRPGSGFQWGFNYEVIWDKVGNILVDVVAPYKPGQSPDKSTKVGLAILALQTEVRLLDDWATRVKEAKKLHDAVSAMYPDLMSARAASAEAAGDGEGEAEQVRRPDPSNEMEESFDRLTELRASEATKYSAESRRLAHEIIEALSGEEAKSSDKEAFQDLLTAMFKDAQDELLELADFENEYAAVNLRLWRSLSAARTLSLLSVSGENDETLHQVLRVTQFALDNLMGFRVTPLKAFPQLVLRFKQRFTGEGMPMVPQPAIPAFMDAIQNFQRPTPEVMNFLLHMMAASALTGENQNATIRQEKYFMLNADVTTFRALAARGFFAIFRHGDVLPDADRYLDLFNFYTGDVQGVLALEKTSDSEPSFQLYPPVVRGPDGTMIEPEDTTAGDWLTTLPERSPLFTFDSYKDALVRCVLYDREKASDAAKWRREMNDDQKTAYCRKWVEPWASRYASEMRNQEIPKLEIEDSRCWTHMKNVHEGRFQFCIDIEAGRTPAKDLGLSKEDCKEVREYDDDYLYCVDLRFAPQYLESGKPTLWGCYDEFPWLRAREAIGPVCEHIAGRTLAAYLYVKFRSAAGVPAADGVAFDKLNGIMTLDELMRFAKTFGEDQDEELFRKLDLLVQELAKVQVDVPVFQRPRSDSDREARTNVRKPEDVEPPMFIPAPWYWHDDWVERQPRTFEDLRATFMESCRPEDDETSAECAKDGGKLGNQMKITIEGGQPGPLMQDAAGLAIMLMRQDLVGVAEMREALNMIESQCWTGSGYTMSCLRDGALEGDGREKTVFVDSSCRGMVAETLGCTEDPDNPEFCQEKRDAFAASLCSKHFTELVQARGVTNMELNRRVRSLYLLAALADSDRAIAETAVGDLLIAVDSDPRFLPPVTFGLQKIRPVCCPPGEEGGCDKVGCERVRLFAQYWNTQPIRDTQVPDIDALYYMLLASR